MSRTPKKRSKSSPKRAAPKKVAPKKAMAARPAAVKKATAAKKGKAAKPAAKPAKPAKLAALKPIDFAGLSTRQIIARLFNVLTERGYDPVLIAHGCAAFYSSTARPKAVEFVISDFSLNVVAQQMAQLGFHADGMTAFTSPRCPVEVILSPPPLAAGDDVVRHIASVKTRDGTVRMLTETDCVRQLLSMFYRWGDRDAFRDAVEVARACRDRIDLELVKRWSEWEWCMEKYEEFLKKLNEKPRKA